jgi:hypothetical protein
MLGATLELKTKKRSKLTSESVLSSPSAINASVLDILVTREQTGFAFILPPTLDFRNSASFIL